VIKRREHHVVIGTIDAHPGEGGVSAFRREKFGDEDYRLSEHVFVGLELHDKPFEWERSLIVSQTSDTATVRLL
jgi:hypothetical protein